jgi:hypothetical protein
MKGTGPASNQPPDARAPCHTGALYEEQHASIPTCFQWSMLPGGGSRGCRAWSQLTSAKQRVLMAQALQRTMQGP